MPKVKSKHDCLAHEKKNEAPSLYGQQLGERRNPKTKMGLVKHSKKFGISGAKADRIA